MPKNAAHPLRLANEAADHAHDQASAALAKIEAGVRELGVVLPDVDSDELRALHASLSATIRLFEAATRT